jgi:hypothetical protein
MMDNGYLLNFGGDYCIDNNLVSKKIQDSKDKSIELADYLIGSGHISARKVLSTIFPAVNADIFLSHSHRDLKLATQIAIDIEKKTGKSVFIDSFAWGNSAKLLNIIDRKYCWDSDSNMYNYPKRNQSTTHIHMILTTALQSMIFNTKNFMFLQSECSISTEDFVKHSESTDSAWIHMELKFSQLLSKTVLKAAFESMDSRTVPIIHEAPIDHLKPIDLKTFEDWLNKGAPL